MLIKIYSPGWSQKYSAFISICIWSLAYFIVGERIQWTYRFVFFSVTNILKNCTHRESDTVIYLSMAYLHLSQIRQGEGNSIQRGSVYSGGLSASLGVKSFLKNQSRLLYSKGLLTNKIGCSRCMQASAPCSVELPWAPHTQGTLALAKACLALLSALNIHTCKKVEMQEPHCDT